MEQLSLFDGPTPIVRLPKLPQTDIHALYAYAKEQAQLHWGREFDAHIELVTRDWRCRQACYYVNFVTGDKRIKMSAVVNKRLTWDAVKGNLLHELVHWHLHTSGQPWGDDDIEFARECLRVGAPFSGTKKAQAVAAVVKKEKHYE